MEKGVGVDGTMSGKGMVGDSTWSAKGEGKGVVLDGTVSGTVVVTDSTVSEKGKRREQ